jgi:hypothetical protein
MKIPGFVLDIDLKSIQTCKLMFVMLSASIFDSYRETTSWYSCSSIPDLAQKVTESDVILPFEQFTKKLGSS